MKTQPNNNLMPDKLNMAEIAEYLKTDTSPLELAKCLDEIEHTYTQLSIGSPCGPDKVLSSHLFELRRLRDIMLKVGGVYVFCDPPKQ